MKRRNKGKRIVRKLMSNLLFIFNLCAGLFVLGTAGSFENFNEVSKVQWTIVIIILVVFYLEIKVKEAIEERKEATK